MQEKSIKHSKKLRNKILFFSTGILIALIGLFFVIFYFVINSEFASTEKEYKKIHLQEKLLTIQTATEVARNVIVQAYFDYTSQFNKSKEIYMNRAFEYIRNMRFGKNGYLFIYNYDGVNLMHPMKPQLEGKNLWNLTDKNGVFVIRELVKAAKNGGGTVEYVWDKPDTKKEANKIGYAMGFDKWQIMIGTGVYIDDIKTELVKQHKIHQQRKSKWLFLVLIIGLVIVIFSIFINLILANSISKVLIRLQQKINNFAQGKGDLTKTIVIKQHDETSMLANTFNKFVTSLKTIVIEIKKSIDATKSLGLNLDMTAKGASIAFAEVINAMNNINTKVEEMDTSINNFIRISEDQTKYIKDIHEKILSQTSNIDESSAAIEEMTVSIENVKTTAENKLQIVEDLKLVASNGETEMQETINIIKKITESAGVIMNTLSVINNITAQTNLLAMNAAIEAAHAGESGRGFNVVANEIRKLAENTAINSKNISNSLKEVISNIATSEKLSAKTGDYFKNIVEGIADVSNGMFEIKNSMLELSSGSKEISTSLSTLVSLSSDIEKVSNEIANKAEVINSTSTTIGETSSDVKNSIIEMNAGFEELSNTIKIIKETGEDNLKNVEGVDELVKQFKTE